jgi:Reverse transcriptase (RNA-dependent DNA polymerase)
MVNSLKGVSNTVDINVDVKMGNGSVAKATKKGTFRGTVKQLDGEEIQVCLDVKYVPDLWCNLFSIGTALHKGWKLSNEGSKFILTKDGTKINFDRKTNAGDGHTMMVFIEPKSKNLPEETASAATNLNAKRMNINDLHRLLGHPGDAKVKEMAKYMNIMLIGKLETCEFCKLSKAKRTKIPKINTNRTNVPGQRIYTDIAPINSTSAGNSKYWLIVIDEATDMKWSYFLKKRSEFSGEMLKFVSMMKNEKTEVTYLRMDGAGENRKFQDYAAKRGFGELKFEFTAPGTPQQNGIAERSFPTLLGRVRAMMNNAGFDREMRGKLWAECARTATMMENSMPDGPGIDPPMVRFSGENYKWVQGLRTFGEMAVLTNTAGVGFVGKLDDKGRTCIFVGYSENYPSGTLRFYNDVTGKILHSRDINWLNKTWSEYMNIKTKNIIEIHDDDSADGYDTWEMREEEEQVEAEAVEPENQDHAEQGGNEEEIPETQVSTRLSGYAREMYNLNTNYNQTMVENVEEVENVEDVENLELACLGAIDSGFNEPANFKEAWFHEDSNSREKWRMAIMKEYDDMTHKQVWKVTKKASVPKERKLIGSKWVFKIKKNGTYRARLVALGYSQLPGIDFTDNFAPVIHDVTFRIMLLIYFMLKYDSKIIDVETAFLYGDLDEEIYMKIPEGLKEYRENNFKLDKSVYAAGYSQKEEEDECLYLNKSIYGLVQAARQWWKKFVELLTALGFKVSNIDPCLLYKESKSGMVYLCLYVDDVLLIGDTEAINEAVNGIKKTYSIKEIGKMYEYVGCTIIPDDDKIQLIQPDLIQKLKKIFGPGSEKSMVYSTPAAPGEIIIRPVEGDELVTSEEQTYFRKGVGMLLYLVKHSRPDISNAVRELAKVMDGASPRHMKNLHRTVKYVLDTKDKSLVLKPTNMLNNKEWILTGRSDSDYAGDKQTRTSVSGYVIYLNGALISWKSRGQKSVTLSSTEAEYIALAELCTEIIFIKMVIESIGMTVKTPVTLHADNIGAIFLAGNSNTGKRTKHIDVRYHFIRGLINKQDVEVKFVKTTENDADIYTKNTSGELFKKHTAGYMQDIDYDVTAQQGG